MIGIYYYDHNAIAFAETNASYDRRGADQAIDFGRPDREGIGLGFREQELRNLLRSVDHEPVACFHRLNRAVGIIRGDRSSRGGR